jgi:hypothetical protein
MKGPYRPDFDTAIFIFMTKKIYKYILLSTDNYKQAVAIPEGSIIQHVSAQGNSLCMWVQVDTEKPLQTRYFYTCPTGGIIGYMEKDKFIEVNNPLYCGTALLINGSYVIHLFEII